MNKVYVVVGYMRDEGEDIEWVVAVYPDQETAEQHTNLAQEAIDKVIKEHGTSREDIKTPYDKSRFYWYQKRIRYAVRESIFVRHVDEYLEQE